MNRHAYLIMAHSQIDILKELLKSIDDERNDVFLHIDKKFLSAEDWDSLHMEKSNLQMIPPMSVNWGGYSQVECTLRLMEAARSKEHYHYYHFMTGVTYPLRNQDEIHRFFQKHEGSLF
ncbi:MAG: hypothetical protein J6D18_01350 [Erysipelotrichaceae bacterium]|nr:hypothetical protein [Erysipelotrichaceae bacterium]